MDAAKVRKDRGEGCWMLCGCLECLMRELRKAGCCVDAVCIGERRRELDAVCLLVMCLYREMKEMRLDAIKMILTCENEEKNFGCLADAGSIQRERVRGWMLCECY